MMSPRILVIDDQFGGDVVLRRDLCQVYGLKDVTGDDDEPCDIRDEVARAVFFSGQVRAGDTVTNSIPATLEAVRQGWLRTDTSRWALVLLDLRFVSRSSDTEPSTDDSENDDLFGLTLLKAIRREFPDLPVVILSSRERSQIIEECRRSGATDFIQRLTPGGKPREVLKEKLHEYGLIEDQRGVIIGRSIALLKLLASARRAASGAGNILILGESGTGKESLARYVHEQSPKAKGPYQIFHAFGNSTELQEDVLFGHVKGAFTDAKTARLGLFELANKGTLFIDEIGDIPVDLQNKLLRPIESRRVTRQGDHQEVAVDLQLVLATNKALQEYARTGTFKSDLLNRIRAYTLTVPSLADRTEDVPLLVSSLLQRLCREHNALWPRTISPDAMSALMGHDWRDGNIREMRNVLERTIKDNKDSELVLASDLGFETRSHRVPVAVETPTRAIRSSVALAEGTRTNSGETEPTYEDLFGSWTEMQRGIALSQARVLAAAIRVTRKRTARTIDSGKINVTGAVSCLLGRQVTTVQAADFVKRTFQLDDRLRDEIFSIEPVLKEVWDAAMRHRPPRQKASKGTE